MSASAVDGGDHGEVLLVTGSTGLLGSHLLPLLHAHHPSRRIVAVVRQAEMPDWMRSLERLEVVRGDLRDADTWQRLPESVTRVFHVAASVERDPQKACGAALVRDNLEPVAHLVEQSRTWPGLRQVVYSSSISVFGHTTRLIDESCDVAPVDLYAASKLAGEQLLLTLRARGVRVVCLRYTSLYGAGMRGRTVLPTMIRTARERGEIVVSGRGRRSQDFLCCEDAAHANLLAYARCAEGVYVIGSGASTAMGELARLVSDVFTYGRAAVVFAEDRSEGPPGYRVSIAKARRELDYCPRHSLEAGLRRLKERIGDSQECVLSRCS